MTNKQYYIVGYVINEWNKSSFVLSQQSMMNGIDVSRTCLLFVFPITQAYNSFFWRYVDVSVYSNTHAHMVIIFSSKGKLGR